MSASRHKPNRFAPYIEIHNTVIDRFTERRFIGFNSIEFKLLRDAITCKGQLGCSGQIIRKVDKFLDVLDHDDNGNLWVQTKWYAYNVSVQGYGNIFRYDNQDEDYGFRNEHQDPHHKHSFDWKTDEELLGSPHWIGSENWPTLGDVIQETQDWYWNNQSLLSYPDLYPNSLHLNY